MRRVIKTLAEPASELLPQVAATRTRLLGERFWNTAWRDRLRRRVDTRRTACTEALTHATGVYFPRRLHSARIGIKKLRYRGRRLLQETGMFDDSTNALRQLAKAQDLLGEIHDRALLRDALDGGGSANRESDAVLCLIDEEIASRHRRFVARRSRVASAIDSVRLGRPDVRVTAAVAGIGVASAFWLATQAKR